MPLEVRPLEVRPLDRDAHLGFVTERSASFLQCPSWAGVKAEWGNLSLGWYDGDRLVGAALVLLRRTPGVERYLAYLPEGPVLDWSAYEPADVLAPLTAMLKRRKVFAVKIGPQVPVRRWSAATLKEAIAAGAGGRLGDVPSDSTDKDGVGLVEALTHLGWRQLSGAGAGFGDVQPRYVFQLPLAGRSEADVLAGFNQLWRRNIKKAEKAGVVVERAGPDDLAEFHALYLTTAKRDGFTPRGLAYFQRMWRAMTAEDPDRIRLYLARLDGEALAATTAVRVGDHVWYSYGASADHRREVRPSNAVQWRMMRDALAEGAAVYDLRGISDTLDPEDHLFGLIQFKLGTGGEAVEYVGEWDFPLSPLLYKAFTAYLARR
ncbi:MAG TPA: peptidoglycan bridge formation glycyltransferase FemA/FemB family protein [Actinomycetes bacterium]|nr:peptidoglycan bridge formation glycyltransferase FemA/FemB family protein [Actinomycetes bacterium]